MSFRKQIILHVALLLAALVVFELTDLDVRVQDHLYDSQNRRWLVDKDEPIGLAIFYFGAKGVVIAVGVTCAAALLLSIRIPKLCAYRQGLWVVALSTVLVPLILSGSRKLFNMNTPGQSLRYGGTAPRVKLLESYPPDFHSNGRYNGFPGGHAAGGFALMALYFTFRRKFWRILGLSFGMAMGLAMGIYKILNGEHFISSTVVSFSAAWIIILLIRRSVGWAALMHSRRQGKPSGER